MIGVIGPFLGYFSYYFYLCCSGVMTVVCKPHLMEGLLGQSDSFLESDLRIWQLKWDSCRFICKNGCYLQTALYRRTLKAIKFICGFLPSAYFELAFLNICLRVTFLENCSSCGLWWTFKLVWSGNYGSLEVVSTKLFCLSKSYFCLIRDNVYVGFVLHSIWGLTWL